MSSGNYGNYRFPQDAYLYRQPSSPLSKVGQQGFQVGPGQYEYLPPKQIIKQQFTDPNAYTDKGSYSDMYDRGDDEISYQATMPTVTPFESYMKAGMYNPPEEQPLPDSQQLENPMPATNKPEYQMGGYNSNFFNVSPKHGPVYQLFFSKANIERLGDFFEKRGLGRPSGKNMREYMDDIWSDNPDFLYEWRRDINSVKKQLLHLNSLLIADYLPLLQGAKEQWLKYQYDSYYGYGYTLLDQPENVSCKHKNYDLEIDSFLYY